MWTIMIGVGISLLLIAGLLSLPEQKGKDPVEVRVRPSGTLDDVLAFSEREDFNVLFILVDTLRADHLSAYGYDRETSPNIAALAETGIRFARHVSQSSWTKCSMTSLWTGLYPARTRVVRSPHVISEDAVMPAEIFRDAGFRTAGIWRNGWIAPEFGFAQGFMTYTEPKSTKRDRSIVRERPNVAALLGSDADLLVSARSFLRTFGHERWFLYMHMMDVHQYVYTPDEAVFGTGYLDIYDSSILWVDKVIGEIIGDLELRGLRDRTLIVFASDHGEGFNEHGNEGHARDIYGEVTTTPLILSFPFRLEPGLVVDSLTANVDLWPTVLDLTGLPDLIDPDGRSRVPDIIAAAGTSASGSFPQELPQELPGDEPQQQDGAVFSYLDQTWGQDRRQPEPLVAVDRGPWRLFYPSKPGAKVELYDKSSDPTEQHNVVEAYPGVTEELTRVAQDHLDGPLPPWGDDAPSLELEDMQVEMLRALGYGVQ
jgi:arylsulfatase A-like enzyme